MLLRKDLYGLKHAPREWNHTFILFLTEQWGVTMQQSRAIKSAQDAMVAFPNRELIGSLMYLMVATRPDLAFSLSKLSKINNVGFNE